MAVNQSLDIYSTIDAANVQSGTSNIPLTPTLLLPRKAQSSKDLFRSFAKKEITLKAEDPTQESTTPRSELLDSKDIFRKTQVSKETVAVTAKSMPQFQDSPSKKGSQIGSRDEEMLQRQIEILRRAVGEAGVAAKATEERLSAQLREAQSDLR